MPLRCPHPIASCVLGGIVLCGGFVLARPVVASPDRVAWTVDNVSSATDIRISTDDLFVYFVDSATSELSVLDIRDWSTGVVNACATGASAVSVAAVPLDTWPHTAEVACSDGSLVSVDVEDDGALTANLDAAVQVTSDSIFSIEADLSFTYVVCKRSTGDPQVHIVDRATGVVDGTSGYPTDLNVTGLSDTAITSAALLVAHGTDDVSEVDLSTGNATLPEENLPGRKMVDLYVSGNIVLAADTTGGLIQYLPSTNAFTILFPSVGTGGDESFQALGASNDTLDPYVIAYDSQAAMARVYTYTPTPSIGAELQSFDAADVSDFVVGDGYAFGAGDGGVQVFTDRPWVGIDSQEPDGSVVTGQAVSITFTSDEDGSWRLFRGGTVAQDGHEIASGEVKAGGEGEAAFTVSGGYDEGANDMWLFVTNEAGKVGHAMTSLIVDNPPAGLFIDEDNVQFGNQQITLKFDASDEEDLEGYDVYVTVTSFNPGDYKTGGPTFDGADDVENPVNVAATPDVPASYTIVPLTNDTTYYVAVRKLDSSGNESTMSNVVSVIPRETGSAAALSGESGGYCGSVPGRRASGLASLLALAAIVRRRRLVVASVAAVGLGFPVFPASAATSSSAATKGNVELRYGPFRYKDKDLKTVYGTGHGVLWIEGGPKLGTVFELDLGVGFFQDLGNTVALNDRALSGETAMFTAWPVTVGGTVRLDFWDEQFLVPFANAGLDYWFWKENWYVNPYVGGLDHVAGGKAGYHYSLGGNLLLDKLDPAAASKLAARSGIQDTYLVGEVRWQDVGLWDLDGGLSLDGIGVTFGLKIDF
jgi:hypothetical protein